MSYNERASLETAADQAVANVPVFATTDRVGRVQSAMAGRRYESAGHVVVCDGERFVGVIRIEDLLAATADTELAAIVDRHAPFVSPSVDQEVAAWRAFQHDRSALPVVDHAGRFVGLIPPRRLVAVLMSEHEEDLSRLGGFIQRSQTARESSEERVYRRFQHRLPWLLVGLVGAVLAADVVAWFEAALEHKVMLAFFIPGIVYLADAVGTQTETIVVRGLSVGVELRRMAAREVLAGIAIGVALGALGGLLVWLRWGDGNVALVVGVALVASCGTATVAALAIPSVFVRLGIDPAFGSGPLATVIQDLLSILIYFAIASALVG